MSQTDFVDITWQGRPVRIEHQWLCAAHTDAPLMVFLHEGLGSVAMWKDFPQQLCEALHMRGLVYSRPGYGQSTPRAADEHWDPDFMHRQAHEVLPALLAALGVTEAPWLFGHSDGGSIALLYAARHATAGLMVMAPHILVEEVSVTSITQARETYENTDLRQRLSRYHADVDSAFWGWNRIWLDPRFRSWSIEEDIRAITCPVLAIQGIDDEYGTLAQIRGIAARVPHTQLLELPHCGHSPHRDQPEILLQGCVTFFNAQPHVPLSQPRQP
ncbi:MAG: alpha/beta fold hydrolase [Limnohabitans sp.]